MRKEEISKKVFHLGTFKIIRCLLNKYSSVDSQESLLELQEIIETYAYFSRPFQLLLLEFLNQYFI